MYSRTCLKQAAKGQGKMLKTGACFNTGLMTLKKLFCPGHFLTV